MNKISEKQKENLSAFVDNEQVSEELANYGVDNRLLHRYQLMGDAIRGSVSDATLVDVSEQVRLAIQSEQSHAGAKHKITEQSAGDQPWFDFGAWLRPLGGMTVAATVAVVMVMVFNQPVTDGISAPGIAANGVDGQIANINTRPVVSLPVSNIDSNLDRDTERNAISRNIKGSEKELEKLENEHTQMIIQHRENQ